MILGNEKEFSKLIPKNEVEITLENVFSLIQKKQKYYDNFKNQQNRIIQEDTFIYKIPKIIQPELDYISSHFYEIDKEKLFNLDVELFECIIKSDKLQLEDEDSLLKIINEMYLKNPKYSYLYSYVNFLFVRDELERFYSIFNIEDISKDIWSSLSERTLKSQIIDDELQKKELNQFR